MLVLTRIAAYVLKFIVSAVVLVRRRECAVRQLVLHSFLVPLLFLRRNSKLANLVDRRMKIKVLHHLFEKLAEICRVERRAPRPNHVLNVGPLIRFFQKSDSRHEILWVGAKAKVQVLVDRSSVLFDLLINELEESRKELFVVQL